MKSQLSSSAELNDGLSEIVLAPVDPRAVIRMLGANGLCTSTTASEWFHATSTVGRQQNGPVHVHRQGGTGCDVLLLVWFMLLGADGCRWPLAAVSGCRAPGAVCALPVAGHRAVRILLYTR